jgi:hypothetical protein
MKQSGIEPATYRFVVQWLNQMRHRESSFKPSDNLYFESVLASGVSRNFFVGRGVQQIQLRTEGRENGDLGAVAPYSGVPLNSQMSKNHVLIRLLRMYFLRNREFGWALSKLRNFGAGARLNAINPPRYATGSDWWSKGVRLIFAVTQRSKQADC